MLAHAPGFDVDDPSYAMLMHGSEQYVNNPYYPWPNMRGGIKGMPVHPSAYQGMSATLAPAVLENNADHACMRPGPTASTPAATHVSVQTTSTNALPTAGLDFNFSQESKEPSFIATAGDMPTDSGQVTPAGEGFWDHFVMNSSWEDDTNEAHHPSGGSNPGSVGAASGGEVQS